MLYSGRSISCADKTNAKSPPLRRVPAQIAPAQWAVGNVLFPTRLRCVLFAKFCFRSLKSAPFRKAKSLGCFLGFCMQGFERSTREFVDDLSSFFRLYRRRLRRQSRRLHHNHRFQSSLNSLSRHDKLTVNRRGIDDAFPNGNLEQPFHRQGIQRQLKSVALG